MKILTTCNNINIESYSFLFFKLNFGAVTNSVYYSVKMLHCSLCPPKECIVGIIHIGGQKCLLHNACINNLNRKYSSLVKALASKNEKNNIFH